MRINQAVTTRAWNICKKKQQQQGFDEEKKESGKSVSDRIFIEWKKPNRTSDSSDSQVFVFFSPLSSYFQFYQPFCLSSIFCKHFIRIIFFVFCFTQQSRTRSHSLSDAFVPVPGIFAITRKTNVAASTAVTHCQTRCLNYIYILNFAPKRFSCTRFHCIKRKIESQSDEFKCLHRFVSNAVRWSCSVLFTKGFFISYRCAATLSERHSGSSSSANT